MFIEIWLVLQYLSLSFPLTLYGSFLLDGVVEYIYWFIRIALLKCNLLVNWVGDYCFLMRFIKLILTRFDEVLLYRGQLFNWFLDIPAQFNPYRWQEASHLDWLIASITSIQDFLIVVDKLSSFELLNIGEALAFGSWCFLRLHWLL